MPIFIVYTVRIFYLEPPLYVVSGKLLIEGVQDKISVLYNQFQQAEKEHTT